jgi:hypothetical protein
VGSRLDLVSLIILSTTEQVLQWTGTLYLYMSDPWQVLWQILVQNLLVHPRSFYTTGTFSLGCVMSAAFLSRRGPFVNTKLALISDLDLFAIVSGHVYVDVTLAS